MARPIDKIHSVIRIVKDSFKKRWRDQNQIHIYKWIRAVSEDDVFFFKIFSFWLYAVFLTDSRVYTVQPFIESFWVDFSRHHLIWFDLFYFFFSSNDITKTNQKKKLLDWFLSFETLSLDRSININNEREKIFLKDNFREIK